jgi:hypothetical protein
MVNQATLDIIAGVKGRPERSVHKFGSNLDVGATEETVWSAGGLYPWSEFSTAQTIYCISTSGSDTGSLIVSGLDENFLLQTETVTMTGLTAASTTNTFIRVFRLQYSHATSNVGTITARVTNGTGTVIGQIDIAKNQSLMAIYTVPDGWEGYLCNYTAGTGKAQESLIELFTKSPTNGDFTIISEMQINNSTFTQPFNPPIKLVERTDIDFRAAVVGGAGHVIVNFDILLNK